MRRAVAPGLILAAGWMTGAGCAQVPVADASASQNPPGTMPAPMPASQASAKQCFTVAAAKDLQVSLAVHADPKDHFPLAVVKVYNISGQERIVAYQPGSIVVHCGDFELSAPGMTFVERREILRSQQPLVFETGPEGWTRSPSTSNGDLLLPIELPSGRYAVWATFRLGGEDGPTVESAHDEYSVP